MQLIIITGMSGSGKSTAVNVLEDMNYYCVDNIPPELVTKFVDLCEGAGDEIKKAAFVIDVRGGDLFLKLQDAVNELRARKSDLKLLYLDSADAVIAQRYKETRRKHPLDEKTSGNVSEAIQLERSMLQSAKAMSDFYIDTTNYSTSELRDRLYSIFEENGGQRMRIDVRSFGFKYGAFGEGDLVFDVRCLPNPFYISELKNKTGLDPEVSGYVMKHEESQVLFEKFADLIDFLIPLYEKEGKSQLVIGFGCTGGKHRSVTFAEEMAKYLRSKGRKIRLSHRDINKH